MFRENGISYSGRVEGYLYINFYGGWIGGLLGAAVSKIGGFL